MAKGKKGTKKGPFDDLTDEFKASIDNGNSDEIRRVVAKVALDQQELLDAKDADQDLKDKQAASTEAGKVYSEGTKLNKLRIKYAQQALKFRGERVDPLHEALKTVKALGTGTKVTAKFGSGEEIVLNDGTN